MKTGRIIFAIITLVLVVIAFYSNTPDGSGDGADEYAARVACDDANLPKGDNLVYLDIASGCVVIELLPKLAPGHAKRISDLVKRGFYDGIVFHRVIDGFMAQTGDPTGTGRGGSDLPDLEAEFSQEAFERGVLGMARSQHPDSANSQFFIVLAPASHLNGQYTAFGRVLEGMEYVDRLKKGRQADNGLVSDPDKIIKMQMAVGS